METYLSLDHVALDDVAGKKRRLGTWIHAHELQGNCVATRYTPLSVNGSAPKVMLQLLCLTA